ncbi:hypothetical protein M23134_04529 [Microscilla marina ATCC 23134]|uniref:Uncharacterized protein n=1 Tax=Microscilla marina ATCC 23134 TaxID=313606 RepID=A1ZWB0_MICM2|nr:hypothetical protein M23134_04529 [Microscilla marina ATCC 23134]
MLFLCWYPSSFGQKIPFLKLARDFHRFQKIILEIFIKASILVDG